MVMGVEAVLISACLLGEACRYDGKSVPCEAAIALAESCELVPVCPERLGGLPTPRTPSEIQPDGRVLDRVGVDRTDAFRAGAQAALAIARERGCTRAILKANSPSCGPHAIYDGTFSGTVIAGSGVAASLLRDAGLAVYDENDLVNHLFDR